MRTASATALGGVALASLIAGFIVSSVYKTPEAKPVRVGASTVDSRPGGGASSAGPLPASFADVADRINPAVVSITSAALVDERSGRRSHRRDTWNEFPSPPDSEEEDVERSEDFGSGVIVDPRGYILTNQHVVRNASTITVKLSDQKPYRATVIGTDSLTDLALIKIAAGRELPAAPLGDSDALRVGEWVIAIGNPLYYEHSVTVGVVSAKGRDNFTSPFDNYIQTDAAINKGNSGGPLINGRGEVVGINTLVSVYGQGIGFAIPINTAKELLPQLVERGRVLRGFLGIVPDPVTPELQEALALPEPNGAVVKDVTPNTPAARAGILRYDVITAIGGRRVQTHSDLYRLVASMTPGSQVAINLFRDGRPMTVKATLEERPPESTDEPSSSGGSTDVGAGGTEVGLGVEDITPELIRHLRLPGRLRGVVVSRVDPLGAAADSGLIEGDVIVEVNRTPVETQSAFSEIVARLKPGAVLLVLYERRERGEYQAYFATIRTH